MDTEKYKTITMDDLSNWGFRAEEYLLDILRGEYDLDTAREDILSFRGEDDEK